MTYIFGYIAFIRGKTFNDCPPYDSIYDEWDWEDGWLDAQRIMKGYFK